MDLRLVKQSGLASRQTTTVVQDIETRWSLKLAMLHSVQCVIREIRVLLKEGNQDNKTENIDIVLMKYVTDLLIPFKAVIIAMKDDKYPTLHGILYCTLHCIACYSKVI